MFQMLWACAALLPRPPAAPLLSWNSQKLMCLQTESPARVFETVLHRFGGVNFPLRSVHRLKKVMPEPQLFEGGWLGASLRKHQLELLTLSHHQLGAGLGTYAQPVDPNWRLDRAIGLNRHFEAVPVQRVQQGRIDLEEGFSTGTDHKPGVGRSLRPLSGHRFRQRRRSGEPSAS